MALKTVNSGQGLVTRLASAFGGVSEAPLAFPTMDRAGVGLELGLIDGMTAQAAIPDRFAERLVGYR